MRSVFCLLPDILWPLVCDAEQNVGILDCQARENEGARKPGWDRTHCEAGPLGKTAESPESFLSPDVGKDGEKAPLYLTTAMISVKEQEVGLNTLSFDGYVNCSTNCTLRIS